jgi:hypothetical protein
MASSRDEHLNEVATGQFSRKLLGYALGRSVQLSDKPLIESMVRSDLRFGSLVDLIVRSRQFLGVRSRHF